MDKPLQGLLRCKTPEHLCFHWLWLWLLDTWGSFASASTLAVLGCPAQAPRSVMHLSALGTVNWLLQETEHCSKTI